MITVSAFRRRQRWAFFTLWYYPIVWTAHLVGGLPPGQDHVHQLVFIVLSLLGLLLPLHEFFPRGVCRRPRRSWADEFGPPAGSYGLKAIPGKGDRR